MLRGGADEKSARVPRQGLLPMAWGGIGNGYFTPFERCGVLRTCGHFARDELLRTPLRPAKGRENLGGKGLNGALTSIRRKPRLDGASAENKSRLSSQKAWPSKCPADRKRAYRVRSCDDTQSWMSLWLLAVKFFQTSWREPCGCMSPDMSSRICNMSAHILSNDEAEMRWHLRSTCQVMGV